MCSRAGAGSEKQDGNTNDDRAVGQIKDVPPSQIDEVDYISEPYAIGEVPQRAAQYQAEREAHEYAAIRDTAIEKDDSRTDEDRNSGEHESSRLEHAECGARVSSYIYADQPPEEIHDLPMLQRADHQALQ
jgi:hypothetical protein